MASGNISNQKGRCGVKRELQLSTLQMARAALDARARESPEVCDQSIL